MKRFCESWREHSMKKINLKNEVINKRAAGIIWNAKICYICEEKFENKYVKDKKYHKVRDHCHYTGECRGGVHSICKLNYSVPKKIPLAFHNWSSYDYHFSIKELAEEFKKQFTCLGENTEKYITFTVPIEKKVIMMVKDGEEITKIIFNILQFIDSAARIIISKLIIKSCQ